MQALSKLLKPFTLKPVSAVLLAGVFLVLQGQAMAQGPKPQPTTPKKSTEAAPIAPSTTHEMTAADVESFLDGVMPLQLQREDIAGAVIVVVKDGKVLFAKGYGYSDVEKKAPVSPENTLFRPGSVSKLFTWTAVMQQVEQGKLDLDKDVNEYLDFKIPPRDGKPITLRNIMTHTPGFEETIQRLFVPEAKDLVPLGDYLKAQQPNRVYAPGTTPAYSNYATAVAGYIVQRVSGQPFDDYIDQHILAPLKMTHTSFRQPLPEALQSLMSKGYQKGSEPAKPYEIVQAAPAGSSAASANDMAHFMMAHLQNGQYEGAQILKPETAQLMHSAQFKNIPQLNGMALGFYEETRNGHRIIGHGGDTQYFHSDLHLMPEANLGFFVSYNSAGKGEISPRTALWEKFLDRYFPFQAPNDPAIGSAAKDAAEVAGRYINSRRGDTTIFNVFNAVGQMKVIANSDGTITLDMLKDLNGEPKKFREFGPMLFREVGGQDLIGIKQDAGRTVLVIGEYPFMVFQKARWYENSGLNMFIIVGAIVVFALTLLLWPVGALIRRHYGRRLELEPGERKRRLLVRLVCLIDIAFLLGFVLFFTVAMKDIGMLSPKYNGLLRLIQLIGWLGVIGTVIALINAARSWATPGRWIWAKLGDALIALSCLGFVWFVFLWSMLHFSLRY